MQPVGQIVLTLLDNGQIKTQISGKLDPPLAVYLLEKAKIAIMAGPSISAATPEDAARVNMRQP